MWKIGVMAVVILLATASSAEGRCEECLAYQGQFAVCLQDMPIGYAGCSSGGGQCHEQGYYGDCCDLPPEQCPPPPGFLADGSAVSYASGADASFDLVHARLGTVQLNCARVIMSREFTVAGRAHLRATTRHIVI